MNREQVGLMLDHERRHGVVDLWERVTLGPYTLMRQGPCVLLVKKNTVVWSEAEKLAPDADQRQPSFD